MSLQPFQLIILVLVSAMVAFLYWAASDDDDGPRTA